MSARAGRRLLALALALPALLAWSPRARADGVAPGDSLLHAYVRSLSDSTDSWFGVTAAPVDTAGLDSALAAGLAKPPRRRGWGGGRRGVSFDWSPALAFDRAEGGRLGLGTTLRSPLPGEIFGRAQWTTGTHEVLGEGGWRASRPLGGLRSRLSLRVAGGRWSEAFDRDHYEPWLSTAGALFYGSDRNHYVRRDGFVSSLRVERDEGYASAGWRDQREASLPYTTHWTLFRSDPALTFVLPATPGRARELALEGDVTIPRTRFRVNAAHWTSDPRMGSDFRYRRTRVSLGGDLALGRHFALVPQASYGRLRGDALPQEAFFLGGAYSLRTFDRNALAGTGLAFARVDLVLVDDLHARLHLPLPAWLPLQGHVFAASGALWGSDAASGAAVPTTRDGPRRSDWRSEVGGGLSWRPGLPDPLASLRFEYSSPLGADARSGKFTLAFERVLFLLPSR